MAFLSTTLESGVTVTTSARNGHTWISLQDSQAPKNMQNLEIGRVVGGGFQPHPNAEYALSPEVLDEISTQIKSLNEAHEIALGGRK